MGQLSDAWEENAAAWIAWAREPGHDSYWRFHRDLFLELVPAPAGRTLDSAAARAALRATLRRSGTTSSAWTRHRDARGGA